MTATIQTGRDDIMKTFTDAWKDNPHTKYVPLLYENTKHGRIKVNDPNTKSAKPWARVTVRHVNGQQTTLSNGTGQKRFNRVGLATVQIFTPSGDGLRLSDKLVESAMSAFEGGSTANQVWFKNVRANEIGIDGPWYQVNVLAEFEYDNIK